MRIFSLLGSVFALALPVTATASDLQLAPNLYGSYAPAGDCGKQPRINVDKTGINLDTAAGKRGPLPIMVSYTWFGGASYSGIQTWVLVKHGGKDRWGEDKMPLIMTFNFNEKPGVLSVDRNLQDPLDGPLNSIAQAKSFRLCKSAAAAPTPAPPRPVATATPAPAPATASAQRPAAAFADVIGALMQPATSPANSFYDWQYIEKAPHVKWAPLPPEMLDKPLANNQFFRRNGTITVGSQSLKIMAAGARTMVMNHYFKNEGRPLGEDLVIKELRRAGLVVTPARCGINKSMLAPTWYRISGAGKRAALLWVAQPRGPSSPWEGFNLALDPDLKPMTAQERAVYTDNCV